jgi:hypothetical protein
MLASIEIMRMENRAEILLTDRRRYGRIPRATVRERIRVIDFQEKLGSTAESFCKRPLPGLCEGFDFAKGLLHNVDFPLLHP